MDLMKIGELMNSLLVIFKLCVCYSASTKGSLNCKDFFFFLIGRIVPIHTWCHRLFFANAVYKYFYESGLQFSSFIQKLIGNGLKLPDFIIKFPPCNTELQL